MLIEREWLIRWRNWPTRSDPHGPELRAEGMTEADSILRSCPILPMTRAKTYWLYPAPIWRPCIDRERSSPLARTIPDFDSISLPLGQSFHALTRRVPRDRVDSTALPVGPLP